MADAFDAPSHDPSHLPVEIPGFEGRLAVSPAGLLAGHKLFVDGKPAPKGSKWGTWALPDGRDVRMSAGFTRTAPSVTVDGTTYDLGEAIPIPLVVLQFLPLGLVGVGGALGGGMGGAGMAINMQINRQPWAMPVKAIAMLSVTAATVVVWMVVVTVLAVALS